MSNKRTIYLEALDPITACLAGVKLNIEYKNDVKSIPYEELTGNLNKENFLKNFGLDDVFPAENVRIITPEEYEENYGQGE